MFVKLETSRVLRFRAIPTLCLYRWKCVGRRSVAGQGYRNCQWRLSCLRWRICSARSTFGSEGIIICRRVFWRLMYLQMQWTMMPRQHLEWFKIGCSMLPVSVARLRVHQACRSNSEYRKGCYNWCPTRHGHGELVAYLAIRCTGHPCVLKMSFWRPWKLVTTPMEYDSLMPRIFASTFSQDSRDYNFKMTYI